jgi:endonuclease/exonuclease/phosphatase (EEP) superfamily protein YafD
MDTLWIVLAVLLVLTDVLPLITVQHWTFRVLDFLRIQLWGLQVLVLAVSLLPFVEMSTTQWVLFGLLLLSFLHNTWLLLPFLPVYPFKRSRKRDIGKESVSVLAMNVYQFNERYSAFVQLVKEYDPDIVLTMESNKDWEKGMAELESIYPRAKKVALENTYGMHFYTRLEVKSLTDHYFTADDFPSIEAELIARDGQSFTFWGVHPPPPSPTEEPTSKERDSELLTIAKRVREKQGPVVVAGDFNNVAWARSSVLFRKVSHLIDPRKGRGFTSTFHAQHPYFRFPIDLFFHSREVFIESFKRLRDIGSDHFPLFCRFYFYTDLQSEKRDVEKADGEEHAEAQELIEEGRQVEADRPEKAEE